MNTVLAKIAGWFQFGTTALQYVTTQHPHGFFGWLGLIGSALAAIGIHAASNTDGQK